MDVWIYIFPVMTLLYVTYPILLLHKKERTLLHGERVWQDGDVSHCYFIWIVENVDCIKLYEPEDW